LRVAASKMSTGVDKKVNIVVKKFTN